MFFVLCVLHYSQSKATIKKLIAASTMCQECSFWLKMTHKTHKYLIRYVWQNIDQHFKYLRVLCFLAKTRIHFLSPHWDLVYIFGGLFHVASQIATSASKNEKHQGFKIGPKPIALSVFYIQSMLWIHIMDFKNVQINTYVLLFCITKEPQHLQYIFIFIYTYINVCVSFIIFIYL